MQITIRELRQVIREEISRTMKKPDVVQEVMTLTNAYVSEIASSGRNGDLAKQLTNAINNLVTYAKWILGRREANAEQVAQFAKLASDFNKEIGFWNTPMFLNKAEHAAKLQRIQRQMQSMANVLATKKAQTVRKVA